MTCDELKTFIDGYVDGELDLVRSMEVEQHAEKCDPCTKELQGRSALSQSMRSPAMRSRAPEMLMHRIRTEIAIEGSPKPRRWMGWAPLAYAAMLLALFAVSLLLWRSAADRETLADQVVSNHVRSLMGTHLYDVESTDQHTVKPWFHGKIDFAPPVRDFAPVGYPLVGGRLDVLDGRTVAAIIYKRREHPINLFVWPVSGSGNTRPRNLSENGYNLIHWRNDGMEYWLISDLSDNELRVLAQLLQAK
jgi:anti-sigma factor RsiW